MRMEVAVGREKGPEQGDDARRGQGCGRLQGACPLHKGKVVHTITHTASSLPFVDPARPRREGRGAKQRELKKPLRNCLLVVTYDQHSPGHHVTPIPTARP